MSLFGLLPQGVVEAVAAGAGGPNPMAQMAAPQVQPPQHSGMFGLKGTFRDVLGVLGDAFLMNSGINPIYSDQLHQEKIGDALAGFDQDPLSAIQRLGGVDAALGQKYYRDYLDSADRQAALAQKAKSDAFTQEGQFSTRLGGMFGAANEATYGPMLANARKRAESLGMGHLLDGLPDTYDKAAVDAWVRGTMEPKDQANIDYRNTRAGQFDAEQQERVRHNKATEGTAATNAATSRQRAGTYGKKVQSDIDYRNWRKTNAPPSPARSGTGRRPAPNIPPPPPGFKAQ